jgi:spore germination cell wall hydrolase CwlJ-like protein
MTNRTLIVIGCSLLAVLLIRQEARMDILEDRLDEIHDVIQTRERLKFTKADVDCLTKNIYYEAGVEDTPGKFAVGHVTINRLKSGRWGDTICKVVYARKQFSWTMLKKLPVPNSQIWAESQDVAHKILAGHRVRGLNNSLYYHATYIPNPKWVDPNEEVGRIGNHVFYNSARNRDVRI